MLSIYLLYQHKQIQIFIIMEIPHLSIRRYNGETLEQWRKLEVFILDGQ